MSEFSASLPFQSLSPEDILNSIEAIGYRCDGHISALNSYENRVYQIGISDSVPLVAKFYRPGRWTDECIREEHEFTMELAEYEIPVITPLQDHNGHTLFQTGNYRVALYPRIGGRAPELDNPKHLLQLGRCTARIHNVSAVRPFSYRPTLDIQSHILDASEFLLANDFLPRDLRESYKSLMGFIHQSVVACFTRAGNLQQIRLHGDSHIGNILWRDDAPFLVDFDDARMGPAVQDLWMFLSGDRNYMNARLNDLIEGYTEFRSFNPAELHIIEALRTMRMVHYAGWLARRWNDPAFKQAFPWFNTQHYWEDQILSLKEQLALMDEPPLEYLT